MSRIINIFINPFVISIPVALLVIFFLPPIFSKYNIKLVDKQKTLNHRIFFHDLNHDGFDEFIQIGFDRDSKGLPFLQCNTDFSIDSGFRIIKQVNFKKHWLEKPKVTFGNYNRDNKDEVYLFCMKEDSLFLLIIEPFEDEIIGERYIAKCVFHDDVPDFGVHVCGFTDLNGDHYDEFIFSVKAGFSLLPRSIFAYDICNDSLIEKDVRYANIMLTNQAIADDKNKGPVIIAQSFASKNYHDTSGVFYSDMNAWLMAFDKNLEFLFPPIKNIGEKTSTSAFPVIEDSVVYIYAYFRDYSPTGKNILRKYSLEGKLLYERICGFSHNNYLIKLGEQKLLMINNLENTVYKVLPDLSLKNIEKTNPFKSRMYYLDIDKQGEPEFIIFDETNEELIIYQAGFLHQVEIHFPYLGYQIENMSICNLRDGACNLFVQAGQDSLLYKYNNNNLYYFKFLVYPGIYLVISLFLFFLLKIQRTRLQNKFAQEKRMTELELLTIKNQIDPHFTFNAINTLSAIFYKEDKKTAHEFLVDFSSLIRNTLNHSKKIGIPLKDEIDFVQNYLKLQQFRFSNKFDFQIQIDKDVNQDTMVPRMIIQTFAENAVKHGLVNKEGKGNLTIIIHPKDNHPNNLQIEIIDDGIGREKSKQVKNYKQISTGKGHDIIGQIVEMYNRLNKTKVGFEIVDLKDTENNSSGTKAIILV